MTEIEIAARIPKEIAEAIINITKEVPSLAKTEDNKFARYKYTPIDGYFEKIPKLAAHHGLFWRMRQVGFEQYQGGVEYTFCFDLIHKTGAMLPEYSRITIIHPLQGAQTAGSAFSYGEKIFMRSTFKIVTGEEDADATDAQQVKPRTKTKVPDNVVPIAPVPVVASTPSIASSNGAAPDNAELGLMAQTMQEFLPLCASMEALTEYWNDNTGALNTLKANAPDLYKKVRGAFTAKKEELGG